MSELESLCKKHKVRITSSIVDPPKDAVIDHSGMVCYKFTLKVFGRQMTSHIFHGCAVCAEPNPADTLSCLLSESGALDFNTFEDWASEFGYDSDSRRALSIYNACVKNGKAVKRLLGNRFREFQRAEH